MNLEVDCSVDRAYEDIPSEDVAGYRQRDTSLLAWVIDGASTLTDHPFQHFPGVTDAGWFARRIEALLREEFADRPFDLAGMAGVLATARSDYLNAGAESKPLWAWPVAAAVVIEVDAVANQLRVYRYADCFVETAMAPSVGCGPRRGYSGFGGIRPRWEPCSGFTGSALSLLRARREAQQRNRGTTALTLDPSSAAHAALQLRTIALPSDILLGSDGLSRLWDTYGVLTRAEAMRYLATEGLASLFLRLRKFEAEHETGALGLKRRDDAIGLHLHLGAGRAHAPGCP
ncbi:hypothetical protein GALL_342780 [mine drainage metagenome]|uniref:Uncharacterized protein n=1 Tax=mine drainage metagenome TaxID=410659 RepID=A0A1J5QK99_9ZZZZ